MSRPKPPALAVGCTHDNERGVIKSGAAAYQPAGPAATVDTPAAKAVKPVLEQAQQEQDGAQHKLDTDRATLQGTQSQLSGRYADMSRSGPRASTLGYADKLHTDAEKQQKRVSDDARALDAAKAKVAAGRMVVYGEQAKADQQVAGASAQRAASSYADLTKSLPKGMSFKQGGPPLSQSQIDSLDDGQRKAYFDYLDADARDASDQSKVYADVAEVKEGAAQLQVYASDPKQYGTIARDVVAGVNKALAPLGLQLQAPPAVDAGKGKANLAAADKAKALIDAGWNYTRAAVPAQAATNRVTAA